MIEQESDAFGLEFRMASKRSAVPIDLAGVPWLHLARAGWVVLAVIAVVILLLAVPGYGARRPMGNLGSHLIYDPTPFMLAVHRLNLAAGFIAVLLSYGLALLLFKKRPHDRMALFMAYYLVIHGLLFGGPVEMLEPLWLGAVAVNSFVLMPAITFPLTMTLFAVFPDGRFVPRWTRWPVAAAFLLAPLALMLAFLLQQRLMARLASLPVMAAYVGGAAILIVLVRAQVYRYRHVSTRLQRQQTKWVLYGFLVLVGLFILGNGPWLVALSLPPETRMPWWLPAAETTWAISTAAVPIALAIAVLRYRLYDVDVLINRTLVYGVLTLSVVVIYVLVVGGLGALLQAEDNLLISLVATGLIAVLFQPMRERVQQWVNRLFFGHRDDPLGALSLLGRRLEAAIEPEIALSTLVETIRQTLKLPYVAISLRSGDEFKIAAESGAEVREALRIPLNYQGEKVGRLIAGPRGPGESFGRADKQLLQTIAHQAGPAAYAVQLTEALRRSRVRLVTAREEERRRLRRDLHDGLGPVLASQGLKMAAVSQLITDNPDEARQLLEVLTAQNEATVAEIRRLVYELRPPALDDLGLVGAVRDYASSLKRGAWDWPRLRVEVQAPADGLPSLPAAIEVAAYRISTEALTNIAHHARAHRVKVCFSLDASNRVRKLRLEIVDDGIGLPENHKSGVGLISMQERAEELGGNLVIESSARQGTHITADLPLVEAA